MWANPDPPAKPSSKDKEQYRWGSADLQIPQVCRLCRWSLWTPGTGLVGGQVVCPVQVGLVEDTW